MIRTKPPSDEYRNGWERVFGESEQFVKAKRFLDGLTDAERQALLDKALEEGARLIRKSGRSWPTAHESDCPAATGDGSCGCPMGNL